jgi:hypothetical protein
MRHSSAYSREIEMREFLLRELLVLELLALEFLALEFLALGLLASRCCGETRGRRAASSPGVARGPVAIRGDAS